LQITKVTGSAARLQSRTQALHIDWQWFAVNLLLEW